MIGVEGQEKLRASRILIIGAGGLGCPAALYLAAAGVGRLALADSDNVDLTNLQRQILYRTESVGAQKAFAARSALLAMNPGVHVVPLAARVSADELDELARDADVVLDCTDNFATQVMVFDRRQPAAACYACLFPEDAEVEEVQCSQMGVFAPLTGMVGAIQ